MLVQRARIGFAMTSKDDFTGKELFYSSASWRSINLTLEPASNLFAIQMAISLVTIRIILGPIATISKIASDEVTRVITG